MGAGSSGTVGGLSDVCDFSPRRWRIISCMLANVEPCEGLDVVVSGASVDLGWSDALSASSSELLFSKLIVRIGAWLFDEAGGSLLTLLHPRSSVARFWLVGVVGEDSTPPDSVFSSLSLSSDSDESWLESPHELDSSDELLQRDPGARHGFDPPHPRSRTPSAGLELGAVVAGLGAVVVGLGGVVVGDSGGEESEEEEEEEEDDDDDDDDEEEEEEDDDDADDSEGCFDCCWRRFRISIDLWRILSSLVLGGAESSESDLSDGGATREGTTRAEGRLLLRLEVAVYGGLGGALVDKVGEERGVLLDDRERA